MWTNKNILFNPLLGFLPIDMSSNSNSLSTHNLLLAANNSNIKRLTIRVFGIVASSVQDLKGPGKVEKVEAFVDGVEDLDDNVLGDCTHLWQLGMYNREVIDVLSMKDVKREGERTGRRGGRERRGL